ncbi:MAG: SAM-dependent methyltransferase [Pseudomonadota bacterium]
MQLHLPEPTADALIASRALQTLIANDIRHKSGWISFARYMELALYAPEFGYYSGGAAKLGKDGDFTTAPEMTPLFGQAVAQVAASLMAQCSPQILEFGAGTGKLAKDILSELSAQKVPLHRYTILEVSAELRARQRQMLHGFPQVRWIDTLPVAFSGIVLGNEVLDAMPVHLVVKTDQGWKERGIGLSNKNFVYRDRPCDPAMLQQIADPDDSLPIGYLTEVHPTAVGFMRSVADMLKAGHRETGFGGAAVWIDYGFPENEYYLPQRVRGTLMCHYRHHAHDDPFYLPGLQDITAHVDFSAIAQAAVDGGLDMLAYMSQAQFLISAGIGHLLLRTPPEDTMRYLPRANAVQRLTSTAEMGELFKVLIVGTQIDLPPAFGESRRD